MSGSSNNAIQLKRPPDEYESLVVNEIGPTADESTFYEAGTFFLDVIASGGWQVTIVEQYA